MSINLIINEVICLQPEAVIHCAAERRPDVVEKDPSRAEKVNVESTRILYDLASKSH